MNDEDPVIDSEMSEAEVSEWYKNTWGTPLGQDCIDLDWTLARWLGERLVFLSYHNTGFPSGTEDNQPYKSIEDWQSDLHKYGVVLQKYGQPDREEEVPYEKAQEAMRWVADHLGCLGG